jgi:hypothetical protein
MTPKHRSAWIWLAVAALSIAVAARAQSGVLGARAYTTPVLQFIAAHTADHPATANGVQRSSRADRQMAGTSTLAAMLPIFFVGLVSPLNLLSPRSSLSIGRATAAPALPSKFQRPPPQLL